MVILTAHYGNTTVLAIQALEDLWSAANCSGPAAYSAASSTDGKLDKREYAIMHRKIVLHLQPMATPTEAMEAMEEDWEKDTGGEQVSLSLRA